MKTVLKVALGIVLGLTVLIVGCAIVIGTSVDKAVDEVQEESDEASITQAEYLSVKTGPKGNTRARVEARFGDPASQDEFETTGPSPDEPVGSECIYYNREGELLSLYQFCINKATGRVESKASF